MGFLGGVLDNGLPRQQRRRQHDVHGSPHAHHVQADLSAMKSPNTGLQSHIVVGFVHIGPQGQEALDVLVDGPGGKVAPAGQSHVGLAEAAQQRTHQVIAGPHFPHQCRIRAGRADRGAVDGHNGAFLRDLRPHIFQNIQKNMHIGNIRHVLDAALAVHQKYRRQNGQRRIFCAADGHCAL